MINEPPIVKNILHAGQKYIPIADGSKVSDKRTNTTRFRFASLFTRIINIPGTLPLPNMEIRQRAGPAR